MNERTRELLLQATTLRGPPFIRFKVDQEKFAELIVMECIKILADNGEFRGCVIIGKHFRVFGVEE
jgi:hypothetical protein